MCIKQTQYTSYQQLCLEPVQVYKHQQPKKLQVVNFVATRGNQDQGVVKVLGLYMSSCYRCYSGKQCSCVAALQLPQRQYYYTRNQKANGNLANSQEQENSSHNRSKQCCNSPQAKLQKQDSSSNSNIIPEELQVTNSLQEHENKQQLQIRLVKQQNSNRAIQKRSQIVI